MVKISFAIVSRMIDSSNLVAATPEFAVMRKVDHLADLKCAKTFHFVDEIPKGSTGKLLKRELAKIVSKL